MRIAALLLLAALAPAQTALEGFDAQRLDRLHAVLNQKIEEKQLPGMVTILARHGKIVEFRNYGKTKFEGGEPLSKDAIFRIYSMTKPITGVAMMILYEQGKWSPGDPISKYIPEFANLKVFKELDAAGKPVLEAPAHPPTMGELMSHTAGFTYGIFGATPVDKMYREANIFQSRDLHDMVGRLAKIPLLYQPGTRWVYSISVDIQGYIVEKLSGKPLGTFFQEQIFGPLGMKDTGFHMDAARIRRIVPMYQETPDGGLTLSKDDPVVTYSKEPSMPSGGGGLLSTATDYYRFAQMLANGGQLDGVRILAPSSVTLMRSNRLPRAIMDANQYGIGFFHVSPGFGFGFDFGVHTDPAYTGRTVGRGTYTWEGAAGTWFWIDPENDVVFVGMIQRMMGARQPDMSTLTQQAVYQALVNP